MENRRAELQRQLQKPDDPMFMTDMSNAVASPLDMRIQSLQARLDELLTKYTEMHPEVVQIRKMISELEAERQQELDAVMAEGPETAPGMAENPVYQQMRTLLSQADASVAEYRVRVEEHEKRVKELEEKVNSIPLIEAELAQLNRDYDVIRSQQSQLLQRRESARMSEDVEQNAGDVVFRVIDPPFVPQRPDEPNKLMLNSGVLVIALGAALGLGLLVSLVQPVVVDGRALGNLTGLPVLGCVTQIRTAAERRPAFVNLQQYHLEDIFPPVQLRAKNFEGKSVAYMPQSHWIDGSVHEDIPKDRVGRLHNINHYIVSQTNPYVVPFLNEGIEETGLIPFLQDVVIKAPMVQLEHLLELVQQHFEIPGLGSIIRKAHAVARQTYSGDITIYPERSLLGVARMFNNLGPKQLEAMMLEGRRATWPKIERIRNTTQISRTFDACLQRMSERYRYVKR